MTAPFWQRYIGAPHRDFARGPDAYDCLGVVLEVQRGAGYEIADPLELYRGGQPESFSDAWLELWQPADSPRLYDLALFRMPDANGVVGWHVGCLVEPNRIIHATAKCGVVTQRFDYFQERGYFKGWWRPRAGAAIEAREVVTPSECPLGGTGASVSFLGNTIFEASPLVGGLLAFVGNLAIAGVISVLSKLIARPKRPSFRTDPDRPSFDLSGPRNTVSPGTPIPVVYGEHPVGGQIIQLFQRVDSEFRSRLYMLICVGHGPVYSIGGQTSDVTSQPSSLFGDAIKINGNPIGDYPTARVSTRLGTVTQDPIPGFEESVISGSVNAGLRRTVAGSNNTTTIAENVDTVTYTTSGEIDAFEINVNFPAGLYKLDSAGNSQPYQWLGTLRYRIKGNAASEQAEFITLGPGTIKANHTRVIRKQNLTRDVYEISLTRSSLEDTNTTNRFSVATWTTVNEINSSLTLAYPTRSLVAIEALATDQLSGSIPQVASTVKGKLCWVWDGVSTTVPAFTQTWTNNPAWIALDVVLSKQYGMGDRWRLNEIDLQSFKDWADYCAATITTDGTSHARWEFNHVFDNTQRAGDVLAQIASAGRANIIQVGSKLRAVIDRETTYSQMFTMGNITAGSFKRNISSLSDRANVVELQYLNRDANYDQDVASLTSLNSTTAAIKKDSLRLIGITRAVHAYRATKHALNVSQSLREIITFRAHIDSIAVEPGDVGRFAHDAISNVMKSGRVVGISLVSLGVVDLKFDRPLTIPAGWTFLFRTTQNGFGPETFVANTSATTGTYAAGDNVRFTSMSVLAFEVPDPGSIWMAGPSATYYKDYRIIGAQLEPDFMVQLSAIEYDADVYDDDPGAIEQFTDQWPSSLFIPDAVTELTAREVTGTRKDGTVDHYIDVAFQPSKASAFDVWFRSADLESSDTDPLPVQWQYAGETRGHQFRFGLGAHYKRTIEISVTPRGPGGAMNDAQYGTRVLCAVQGRCAEPGVPTSLVATLVDSKILLSWTAPTDTDVREYEIRASADASRWIFAQPIDIVRTPFAIVDPSYFGSARYYLVKAISRSGVPSFTAASVSVTPSSGGQVVILDKSITGSAWTSGTTVSNASLVSSNLRTDAGVTTASWTSANTTFPILSQQATIRAQLDAIAYDLTTTAEEAGYRFDSTYARRLRGSGELIDVPWPEQPIAFGTDLDLLSTSPLAACITMSGEPYPWATNYKVLLEYDLATDTGATAWDGWKTYTKPFEAKARYFVRWRVTMTIANAEFTIDLTGLYVNVSAVGGTLTNRDDQTHLDDHFQSASTETGEVGMAGWNISGTGSSVAMVDAETTHWGVASIATSATTGNFGGITTTRNFFPNATSYIDFTTWVKVVDTANCTYQIGFMQNTGTKTPTRGIYVKTASGGANWSVNTVDATSTTATNSGLATSSAQWWCIRIQVYGVSSVVFTLTSDSGSTATATHTTNIPNADALLLAHQVGNDTNAVKTLYVDRSRLIITGNKAV